MVKRFYNKIMAIIVVTIVVSLVIPTLASAYSKEFSDVKKGASHYTAIMELTEAGIIQGFGDGTFGINDSLQRRHGAVLLYEALDLSAPTNVKEILTNYYNDININSGYAEQIAATTPSIFKGSNKIFGPLKGLTREQMATAIVKAFDLSNDGNNPGINLSNVSDSHKENVKILAQHGITNQFDNFRPDGTVTRGQFATFIYKTMASLSEADPESPEPPKPPENDGEKIRQYDTTHYNLSFSNMLDVQMTKNPQTDSAWKWYEASRKLVEYYANPRNFDKGSAAYFQFLSLSQSADINAQEINEKVLDGMGSLEGTAETFIRAGEKYNINEVYLIAHALLETGNGQSELSNGYYVSVVDNKEVPKKKTYNMYGIHAYDSCALRCGSEHAYEQGWFTPEAAIIGGAKFIADDYVNDGQNTLYKMRWNPASPGFPQYATDVGWAVKQTARIKKIYDLLDTYVLKFDVPSFNNQPGSINRPVGNAEFAVDTSKRGMTGKTTAYLNFRAAPSIDYTIIDTLALGAEVEILGENSGWYKVKVNGKNGWVSGKYIELNNIQKSQSYSLTSKSISMYKNDEEFLEVPVLDELTGETTRELDFKTDPSTASSTITTLNTGTKITILDQRDGWYKIEFDGNTGWISGDYIKVN